MQTTIAIFIVLIAGVWMCRRVAISVSGFGKATQSGCGSCGGCPQNPIDDREPPIVELTGKRYSSDA